MKSVFRLLVFCAFLRKDAIPFAQSVSVDVRVATPSDVRMGGDADLRCSFIGVSLGPDTVVEWRTPNKTLVWHGVSYFNNFAVTALTQDPATGVISQHLEISRLKISDTGTYICNVRSFKDGGGSRVEGTDSVFLNVTANYFPESYPVCAPSGPHAAQLGSLTPLSCTSEPGRPPVTITIWQGTEDVTEMFVAMETNGNLIRHRDLTVRPEDDGVSFLCSVTSPRQFPQLRRTCTIGPLTVLEKPTVSTEIPSTSSSATTSVSSLGSAPPQYPQTTAVIALASSLGILIVVCVIVCVVFSTPVDLFHSKKKSRSPKPNSYDDHAMNLEVFTTREGITEFAYAIPEENASGSDDCSIPLYSVVMGPVETQNRNAHKDQGVSAIVSDQEMSEIIANQIIPAAVISHQERPAIVSNQDRPVVVSDQIRPEIISDREISGIVSNHEIPAGVSHQQGAMSLSYEPPISAPPPPPPLPPAPPSPPPPPPAPPPPPPHHHRHPATPGPYSVKP